MDAEKPTYEFVPSGDDNGNYDYVIQREPQHNYRLHIILFVLTFLSTTLAGAGMTVSGRGLGLAGIFNLPYLARGLSFSIPLMFILLTHEMGHFIASRLHRVSATLPYFIPAPTIIGTFGAFIKMKSPIYDKKSLVDIGAAGPIAGFIVSIPVLIIGLSLSKIVPDFGGHGMKIGSSLLVQFMAWLFAPVPPKGFDLLIHPMGFAGWIGLFVTSLNLIPIGQLDGGHVAYALFGDKYERFASMILLFLIFMGIFYWSGWLFWAIIIMFLGKKHPPALNPYVNLDKNRKIVVWSVLVIFVLTFIPVPFRF